MGGSRCDEEDALDTEGLCMEDVAGDECMDDMPVVCSCRPVIPIEELEPPRPDAGVTPSGLIKPDPPEVGEGWVPFPFPEPPPAPGLEALVLRSSA